MVFLVWVNPLGTVLFLCALSLFSIVIACHHRLTSIHGDDLGLGQHDPPVFIYDALSEQLPLRIPLGGRVTLSVTCAPAELGVSKLCLVLSFSSFQLRRLLTARCVPADATLRRVLAPSAPYVAAARGGAQEHPIPLPLDNPAAVDRGRRPRLATGRHPWPRPRLGYHPLQPAAAVEPALAGGHRSLRSRNYGAYQHALLHAEEAAVNAGAHTASGVTLRHLPGQDLFQIVVPGVAALHPGILMGDHIVVALCGAANTPKNHHRLSPQVRLRGDAGSPRGGVVGRFLWPRCSTEWGS